MKLSLLQMGLFGVNMLVHKIHIIFSFCFGIQHQITLPDHEEVWRETNSNSELIAIWELQHCFCNFKLLPSMATKCVSFTRIAFEVRDVMATDCNLTQQ